MESSLAPLSASTLTALIFGATMTFYLTIAIRKYVPPFLYLFFLSTSFFGIFVLSTVIPVVCSVAHDSSILIRNLKKKLAIKTYERKLLQSQIRILQPIRINVGFFNNILFYFKTSTKTEIYNIIISYVISGLLSYPQERLAASYKNKIH